MAVFATTSLAVKTWRGVVGTSRSFGIADGLEYRPPDALQIAPPGKCVDRSNVRGIDVLVGRDAQRLVIHLVEADYGGAKI